MGGSWEVIGRTFRGLFPTASSPHGRFAHSPPGEPREPTGAARSHFSKKRFQESSSQGTVPRPSCRSGQRAGGCSSGFSRWAWP